jgi:hypothetical protein
MFAQATEQVINYRITPKVGAVRLRFWEDAPDARGDLAPYLYAVNYSLSSVEEAHEVLREYLILNGVSAVDQLEFPRQGCISVLPYPTWSSYQSHSYDSNSYQRQDHHNLGNSGCNVNREQAHWDQLSHCEISIKAI